MVEVVRVRMIGWKGRRANGGFGRDPGERRLWRTVPGSVRGYAGGEPESSHQPSAPGEDPLSCTPGESLSCEVPTHDGWVRLVGRPPGTARPDPQGGEGGEEDSSRLVRLKQELGETTLSASSPIGNDYVMRLTHVVDMGRMNEREACPATESDERVRV